MILSVLDRGMRVRQTQTQPDKTFRFVFESLLCFLDTVPVPSPTSTYPPGPCTSTPGTCNGYLGHLVSTSLGTVPP